MNDRLKVEASSVNAEQDTTIFSLLHAAHVLEDRVEAALEAVGLSLPKYSVLHELVASGKSLSLSELATRLSCVRSNMTQLVDRLEADGVVRRIDDPADRRAVKAEITEAGRERQAAGAAEIAKLHESFATNVSPSDRSAIDRMLSALG
jgi:DNA-binding MarR family transcriptional regulator